MKNLLILLLFFLIVMTISCKKAQPDEILPDDGPFKITTLLPLSDNIPYQLLGSGKILFERKYNPGGTVFYVIDADQKKSAGFKLESQMTQPYISPSGSKIACSVLNAADPNSNWNIYVMNTDGSDCFPVSPAKELANYPTWTKDGSKILYYTSGPEGRLYMLSPVENSSDREELIKFHSSTDPDWVIEPTGGFIFSTEGNLVGVSNSEKLCGIIGIKPFLGKDGVSILVSPKKDLDVVTSVFRVESPVLSPDGLKIAFALVYSNPHEAWIAISLFTMNLDGTNLIQAGGGGGYQPIDSRTRCVSLCWSPDQTKILYTLTDTENTCHIYVVKLDGSGYFQVTNQTNVFDSNVSWAK